ncbi:unnamed protein product, partial [Rotaria sp. Silwood1]
QQSDMEAIQHVQNQVLHFYHLQTNQQQHLVQQPLPPPPQLPTHYKKFLPEVNGISSLFVFTFGDKDILLFVGCVLDKKLV